MCKLTGTKAKESYRRVNSSRLLSIAVHVIALLVIVSLLWWLKPVLAGIWRLVQEVTAPFLVGMLIAYVLHPVVKALERRKMPRLAAVLLIYAMFVLAVSVALINAIPAFARQLIQLADDLPRLTGWYHMWMSEWEAHKYFLPDSVQTGVDRVILQSKERMAQGISQFVHNARHTMSKALGYAVVPFIAFYLLKDMKEIRRAAVSLIPRRYRRETLNLLREVNDTLSKYLHGQMTVALLVGGLAYLGYWLIGMPYPFVLASAVGIANVIPFVGPLIGIAPALLVALTISVKMVLLAVGVNLVIQVLEGNILSPHIMGRSLHLHPLFIIFALLVGEAAGGILGLIVAVPLFAVGKVVLARLPLFLRRH